MRSHLTEFPTYDIPEPVLALVREGILVDTSWHNDSAPSFECHRQDGYGFRLWVEHQDEDQREIPGLRFTLAPIKRTWQSPADAANSEWTIVDENLTFEGFDSAEIPCERISVFMKTNEPPIRRQTVRQYVESNRFKAMLENLRRNYSQWDYSAFCKALGFNERFDQTYWRRWREFVDAMTQFDDKILFKMFSRSE
jgi:hypothetical protein